MKYLLIIILLLTLFGCEQNAKTPSQIIKNNVIQKPLIKNVIYIKSLGDFNNEYKYFVKNWLESFYNVSCIIEGKINLTNDILAKSKTRYDANKILTKFNSEKHILLLTEVDIACDAPDRNSHEWGIFGIGYRPGNVCVVSTYRLKGKASESMMLERLEKVCIHEIGHNFGLSHCFYDKKCIMNDGRGTIKQVDGEKIYFCPNCKNFLNQKLFN